MERVCCNRVKREETGKCFEHKYTPSIKSTVSLKSKFELMLFQYTKNFNSILTCYCHGAPHSTPAVIRGHLAYCLSTDTSILFSPSFNADNVSCTLNGICKTRLLVPIIVASPLCIVYGAEYNLVITHRDKV